MTHFNHRLDEAETDRPASGGADFVRLADCITALSGARGAEEITEIVRRSARGLSGAQGVAVILRDGTFCHYLAEDAESPLWAGQRFPMQSCISGWAMLRGETVAISDVFADPRIPHRAYEPTFVKSLVMTPVGEDRPFAAIGAYWDTVRTPEPDEIAVLEALARSTATAFKNVQLYDSLKKETARIEDLYRQAEEQIVERKKIEKNLRLVVNELNHRVKNSLATVQAMAAQTFRSAGTVREAKESFSLRLQALALIHEMLTEANWDSADLRQIAKRVLGAHPGAAGAQVEIAGPSLALAPKAAASLAMALNELAANAVRHGALSSPAGRVELGWVLTRYDLCLTWRESGGPWVTAPTHKGFGERLLKHGLPADLDGEVELLYPASGVTCVIKAPLRTLAPTPDAPDLASMGVSV